MRELWVKIKPWAVGIACGWLLLAFIFLWASSEHCLCSAETATKIYKAISDIVLLKWVTKYQTLLAGLAALGGGAFVIVANREQIKANQLAKEQELENSEKDIQENHRRILSLISVEFSIIGGFLEQGRKDWHDQELSWIDIHAVEIVRFDPGLLEILRRAQSLLQVATKEIDDLPRDTLPFTVSRHYKQAAIIGYAAHDIFKKLPSLLDNCNQKNWYNNLDATDIREDLNRLKLKEKDLGDLRDLRHYYKWD